MQKYNGVLMDALLVVIVIAVTVGTSCKGPSSLFRDRFISREEAKRLVVANGNTLEGWSGAELRRAAAADQVVRQYGKPKQTAEETTWFARFKVFWYNSRDEFGSPTMVKLVFINASRNQQDLNPPLANYRLVGMDFGVPLASASR